MDEDALQAALPADTPYVRVVEELARAKAADVLEREGPALAAEARAAGKDTLVVVGCDSMLLVDGQLEGKPHTYERAMERWQRMRGRHGVLLTGHALIVADLKGSRPGSTSGSDADSGSASGSENDAPFVVTSTGTDTSDTTVHFGAPRTPTSTSTSAPASLSNARERSLSSRWAGGSSTASRAILRV